MKANFLFFVLVSLFLVSCNGGGSDKKINLDPKLYNMALARFNATATSEADSENLENLIDGDLETFWESEADVSVVIELENIEDIVHFEVFGEDLPTTLSTPSPDLLIEFSEDGEEYVAINATLLFADFECAASSRNSESIACSIDPAEPIKFIRITSQNDNAYQLSAIAAFAWKK